MAVEWTPDPATIPWFSIYAHQPWTQSITATVAAASGGDDDSGSSDAGSSATITGFTANVSPNTLTTLQVVTSTTGVTLSAPNGLPEAFPMVDLEYQIQRVEYHIKKWQDLPQEADEVIAYLPDPAGSKDWDIAVTAHLSDGTTETGVFVLRLLQNFDPGKKALKEAVDARRQS